jgi:hypothetical protein
LILTSAGEKYADEPIVETGPKKSDDFDALFSTADPGAERALDGVHNAANMSLDEEPGRVIADLNDVRAHSGAAAVQPNLS